MYNYATEVPDSFTSKDVPEIHLITRQREVTWTYGVCLRVSEDEKWSLD